MFRKFFAIFLMLMFLFAHMALAEEPKNDVLPEEWQEIVNMLSHEVIQYIKANEPPRTQLDAVRYLSGLHPIYRHYATILPISNIEGAVTGYSPHQILFILIVLKSNEFGVNNIALSFKVFDYREFKQGPTINPPEIPNNQKEFEV
jgi:hypothetical protein